MQIKTTTQIQTLVHKCSAFKHYAFQALNRFQALHRIQAPVREQRCSCTQKEEGAEIESCPKAILDLLTQ